MVELWDSRDGIRAVDHCSTALYIFVYRDHLAPHAPYLALIAGKSKQRQRCILSKSFSAYPLFANCRFPKSAPTIGFQIAMNGKKRITRNGHENTNCQAKTLSKTSISLVSSAKEAKKAVERCGEASIVKPTGKVAPEPKRKNKPMIESDVSVSLVISRNQKASISASCFFPEAPGKTIETSTGISSMQLSKTHPLMRIVDIPLEDEQITNNAKGTATPQFLPITTLNSEVSGDLKKKVKPMQTGRATTDYRVISVDAKPYPGRLENFIPEIERSNAKGFTGLAMGKEHLLNLNTSGKAEKNPLQRDEFGRLIISTKDWRDFLAEQKPYTSVPLNSGLQIIHRNEKYNSDEGRKHKPIITTGSGNRRTS